MTDKWIDVKVALPTDYHVYLVGYRQNNVRIMVFAWFNPKSGKWGSKGREFPEGDLISHWLKLDNPVS